MHRSSAPRLRAWFCLADINQLAKRLGGWRNVFKLLSSDERHELIDAVLNDAEWWEIPERVFEGLFPKGSDLFECPLDKIISNEDAKVQFGSASNYLNGSEQANWLIEKVANSVEFHGNIIVYGMPNRRWMVPADGWLRVFAARSIGMPTLRAKRLPYREAVYYEAERST